MQDKKAIFLIDEIDTVSQKRGTDSAMGGELSRVTVALMQAMDSLRVTESEVILLAATNRVDIMDNALKSRFSITKQLEPLNAEEKQRFILGYLDEADKKLKNLGLEPLNYDLKNIQEYCTRGARIPQRNVEMDVMRCMADWLDHRETPYMLSHIAEEWNR